MSKLIKQKVKLYKNHQIMQYNLRPEKFNLGLWRVSFGFTVRRLAKESGVNYTYISRLENNKSIATPETMVKIFKALLKSDYGSNSSKEELKHRIKQLSCCKISKAVSNKN